MPQNNPSPTTPGRKKAADHLVHNPGFDFGAMFHAVWEKAWLVLLIFVIAILATASYLHRAPVLYQATSTIEIQQEDKVFSTKDKMVDNDMRSLDALRTIEATLKSSTLIRMVVQTNKLYTYEALGGSPASNPDQIEGLIGKVSSLTDVKLRKGTRLIDISVVSRDPKLCQIVANSVITNYLVQNAATFLGNISDAQKIQEKKAIELHDELAKAEKELQAYKEKENSASLDEKSNTIRATLLQMNSQVNQATADRLRYESDYAQIEKLGTNVDALLSIAEVAGNPAIVEAKQALNKAREDFASVKLRYLEKHPKYIASDKQQADAFNNLHDLVLRIPTVIKSKVDGAVATEKELVKALEAQQKAALELDKKSIDYRDLARKVETLKATYEGVLQKQRDTELTKEGTGAKIKISQIAELPTAPFSPDPRKIWTQGILGGLVAGILFALGITSLDTTFKTVDQVEEQLGLPVLSAILQMRERNEDGTALIAAENAKSAGAEAFRSLRTALSMLGKADGRRTFLFTSALPQEGKTFCSVNFAASLAQQGLKTLLIDGDLRRPAVELALVGKRSKAVGVTDYLTGQKKLSEILQKTEVENFTFISAGTTAPNPAELLAQNGINGLIDEALQHFDRVVVDSAPIHAVSDTLLMLDRVQTVCLVVRANKTARRGVSRAVQILQGVDAPLGGVILNRLPRRRGPGYYYNSYYDYSYKDKYGEKGVYGA